MKLHLPKSLLLSLLSALTLASPLAVTLGSSAWAGWAADKKTGGYAYYYDESNSSTSTVDKLTVPVSSGDVANSGSYLTMGLNDVFICSGYGGDNQPSGYSGQISTIGKIVAQDGTSLTIAVNPWQGWKSYTSLTIEELEFGGGTGSGSFNVNHADDNVIVNAVSGTLSSVNNAGNLTLGSVTMGGDITNAGTLSLRGELGGSGTITNSGDSAKLNVDLSGGYGGFNGVVYTYADGVTANGKSGFVRGEQTFRVLDGVTYEGAVYVNDSETTTTLVDGGYIAVDVGNAAVFYVDDTWDYSSEQSEGASSFEVSGAGTLNFAGGSTVEGGMTINSRGAVTMSADTTFSDTVTINGGTFNNDSNIVDGGKLVFNNLSSAEIKGDGKLSVSLELNNTYLSIGAEDTFDYGDTSALTFKIGSGATLDVQSYHQSVSSNHIIEMAGGTLKGAGAGKGGYTYGIDFYNGGRFNTSANSRIETNVGAYNSGNIQFDVNTGVTLTMTGNLVGGGTFSKTAGGTMVYSGAAFNQALTISGGVFEYNFTGERTHTGSITGTGTLRKSGDGTLNLSSANTSDVQLAVTGGKLVYTVADDEKTHTLSGTGGTFEKTGAGTLNLGALTSYDFAGELTVSEGKVVFTGSDDEQGANPPAFVKLVNGLTTVGDAQVEIVGNAKFNYQGNDPTEENKNVITIDDNIHITGNLEINSWASSHAPDGDSLRRWNVNEGGDLSVDGHLWLTNKQKMVVSGGNVTADGGIKLGHSVSHTNDGWGNHYGDLQSKLVLEDGSLTTTAVTLYGGGNEVVMSGGELTFTPSTDGDEILCDNSGDVCADAAANKFTVTGGTLKATDKSWALTGTSTHVVSLGNATFDIAADKTITLSGSINLTGSMAVEGEGTLRVGDTTWNITAENLTEFSVIGGEVADSTQTNGLGHRNYALFYKDSIVVQQTGTTSSVMLDGNAAGDRWNADSFTIDGTQTNDFIINGAFSTAEATTENGAVGADVFVVNKEGVFTIAGDIADGKTAKELVMTTLGTGKIKLSSNVDLSHSGEDIHFAGSLDIESGASLTLGRVFDTEIDPTSSNTTEYDINISSLSSLNLNGGTLKMYYVAPHIKSMTVKTASTIYIDDVWSEKLVNKADATRIDSLQLDANLSMETNWKSNVNIGVLSGNGNLTATQTNSSEGNASHLWVDGVDKYTGEMSLKGKLNLSLNSGDTETVQAVRLSVDDFIGNIVLGGKVAASLNIGESEFLNKSQLTVDSGSSATLTGSGVYDLVNTTSLGAGVTLSDNWEGIVRMSNVTMGPLNVDAYGNAHSYLELIGVNGWLKKDSTEKLTGLILSKSEDGILNGYTVTGSSDHTYKFNGKIKGDGDFTIATSSSDDATFAFNGDLSEYAGGIKVEANANNTPTIGINLTGGGDIFAADANGGVHVDRGGVVNLNIGKAGETTNMHGAVINEGAGTLNVTVQGDTIFNADVDVSKLTITSGVGSVTLSGEQNTIKGALTITEGTGLTLDADSALTVNSPIQNNGNLDIQGTVNWDLSSTEGLTVTYSEEEVRSRRENDLDVGDNGLGAGVISGLITGNSTLTISDNASATVNGKNGTFTDTGLVTVDDVVYYVMTENTSDPTTPDSRVYDVGGGYKIKLSETVNVGNNTYDAGPKPTIDTNEAQGFYVGENGVLCISGATDTLKNISDVFASISGNGDIILRAPGIKTDSSEITEISVYNKIDFSGDLYIAPQGLYSGANNAALFEYGALKLHLFDNADISLFSSIQLGEYSIVDINGTINRANEEVGHFNNVNVLGNTEANINLNGGSNDEIVFGGDTTISPYKFGSSDATGGRLDLHYRQDGTIRIENLKDGEFPPSLKSSVLVVWTDSLGTDNDTHATLYIDSFEYTGSISFYGMQKGTLKAEVTLSEDNQILKSSQYGRASFGPSDESFIIKGVGTYIIDEGFGIEINYGELSRAMAEDNINRIWQGTVQITAFDGSANGTGNGMDFSYYGNEQSTIDMRGVKTDVVNWNTQGVPAQTSSSTTLIESDIIISNIGVEGEDSFRYGYEVTGGIAVQTYTGDISGTGDFVVSAGSNMKFNLQGNISKWAADDTETPEFIVQNGTQALNFSGSATEVNAIIKVAPSEGSSNAALKVSVGDANTAHTTTFNESVVASSLTTYTNTTAQFKGNTTRIGNVNLGAVEDAEAAVIEDGMKIFNGNTVQGGEARNTVMSFEGEGYVSDAKLTNVVLTSTGSITELQEKVSINLKNLHDVEDVYLSGAVNFVSGDTQDNFKFVETIEAFGQTYNEVRFESSSFSGMTLAIAELGYLGNITLTVADGITVADSTEVWKGTDAPTNVSIFLEGFTAEGLTIGTRMEGMFDPLQFDGPQVVALSEDTVMSVSQLLNYNSYREVYFVQQEDGLFIRMSNIPEPTTATLSMLALAALAARRRRR